MDRQEQIARATEVLLSAASPIKIILFGSQARGDADEGSDVDLLVVEKTVPDDAKEIIRLCRALSPLRIPVELLVVRQDQRVDRSILQVSVDNTAPQVRILFPKENTQLTTQAGKTMIMKASASDNLALGRVEFYVDGGLVSTLYEPPFIVLWHAIPGEHKLQVRAYDHAANWDEIDTTFSIVK